MPKNKLITVLSSLDANEWKQVRKYILMHTGRSSDVFRLFEYLQKRRQDWPDKWDTKQVHERLFKKINHKTFLNMMSTLTGWVEESLIIQNTLNQKIESQISLLSVYNSRGLYALADQLFEKTEKAVFKIDEKDERRNRMLIRLYDTIYYSNNPIKYRDNKGPQILSSLARAQVEYGIEAKHLYLAEFYNWGGIIRENLPDGINNLIKILKNDTLTDDHHLSLLVSVVEKNDYKSFMKLKDIVLLGDWDYTSMNHTVITSYLVNFVMKFWHQGVLTDVKIITELYEYGLKTGALLVNGRVPEKRFHNIVSTIGGLSENGWSLDFIDKWGDKINSKNPEANKSLAKAQYFFYSKRYSEITPVLRSLKFEAQGQQTRLMGLQLIAWYEERKEYPDIFLQFALTFKKFLSRNKPLLSPHYHSSHRNLIKILEGLFKDKSKNKMMDIIESSDKIIYRKYLQEKIG